MLYLFSIFLNVTMLCVTFFSILCLSLSVGYGRLLFLVNRAALWSVDDKTFNRNNLNGSLEYRYIDGDAVDISCVSLGRSRAVKLNYNLEENVSYDMIKPYNGGVGLRTTLQQAHNRTNMSCEYFGNNYKILLNVTFILQNTFDDVFYLKINGYTLRLGKNITVYAVYYLDGESLQMECKTNDGDIFLQTLKYGPGMAIPNKTNQTSMKINQRKYRYFTYVAISTSSKRILHEIDILFEPLYKDLTDNTLLKLNTTSDNTLINLYAYNGSQLIYYGYKEGDSLSLNCSTYIEFVPGIEGYYLNFDGTEERNKSHIIKHLQLTAADDNTTITCRLLYVYKNSIRFRREIHVLFRMRFQGDTFAGQQNQTWIVAAVGAAICIVFVACAVVCYMKTRNYLLQKIGAGDTNLDDQQYDNLTYVQTYSAQPEANYADPIRQTHEDTTTTTTQQHELEAIPHTKTPVSTSQEEQTTSDLNYAVLDIFQPGKDLKNSHTEESPYAEIYHDDNALIYTNVPYKRRKDD